LVSLDVVMLFLRSNIFSLGAFTCALDDSSTTSCMVMCIACMWPVVICFS